MNYRVAPTTRSFGCSCNQIACQVFSSIIVAVEYHLRWEGKENGSMGVLLFQSLTEAESRYPVNWSMLLLQANFDRSITACFLIK